MAEVTSGNLTVIVLDEAEAGALATLLATYIKSSVTCGLEELADALGADESHPYHPDA